MKKTETFIMLGKKDYQHGRKNSARRTHRQVDKASEAVGITVTEMMQEAAKAGIKSTETIEEYKKGLRLLC